MPKIPDFDRHKAKKLFDTLAYVEKETARRIEKAQECDDLRQIGWDTRLELKILIGRDWEKYLFPGQLKKKQ